MPLGQRCGGPVARAARDPDFRRWPYVQTGDADPAGVGLEISASRAVVRGTISIANVLVISDFELNRG